MYLFNEACNVMAAKAARAVKIYHIAAFNKGQWISQGGYWLNGHCLFLEGTTIDKLKCSWAMAFCLYMKSCGQPSIMVLRRMTSYTLLPSVQPSPSLKDVLLFTKYTHTK